MKDLPKPSLTPCRAQRMGRGRVVPRMIEFGAWKLESSVKYYSELDVFGKLICAAKAPRVCSGHLFFEQEANK